MGEIGKRAKDIHENCLKLNVLRECKVCQRENRTLEDTEMILQELNRMTHYIIPLQNYIEDQIIIGEQFHFDHGNREEQHERRKKRKNQLTILEKKLQKKSKQKKPKTRKFLIKIIQAKKGKYH